MFAPAKINLDLRVGARADDGFHPLVSWMVAVELFDILEFELAETEQSESAGFSLTCDDPSIPADASNLVLRAAHALLPHLPRPQGVKIRLSKRIPSGAGLGGGSSDAATTLIALNQLLDARLSRLQLAQIASQIGSDVPFFCFGPSSFCQGRGDRVVPLPLAFSYPVVLFLPPIHLPTPKVYQRFDEMNLARTPLAAPDYANWAKLDAKSLMPLLANDLEPAAFSLKPELGVLRNNLEDALGQRVRMSGSGSSLFTLCENLEQAEIFSVLAADKCGIKPLVAPVAKAV